MTNIPAVMISAHNRADCRADTLAQLASVGIAPHVLISPPLPQDAETRNREIHTKQREALRWGLSHADARHILFLEDDIDIAPDFGTMIPICAKYDHPAVTFYLAGNGFRDHIDDDDIEAIDTGADDYLLHAVSCIRGWFGSQALLLRRDVCDAVFTRPVGSLDTTLAHLLPDLGLTMYAVHPNLVQHRQVPSEWMHNGTRQHYSETFKGR